MRDGALAYKAHSSQARNTVDTSIADSRNDDSASQMEDRRELIDTTEGVRIVHTALLCAVVYV